MHGNRHFSGVNLTKNNLTPYFTLRIEGNSNSLMRTRKYYVLGKNTWDWLFLGVNWINEIWPLFDPLFEVTGRRELDSLMRQKHMGIDTYWEWIEQNKIYPLLTPYLNSGIEGNSLALWELENSNFLAKISGNWHFLGENQTKWNLIPYLTPYIWSYG